MSEPQHLTALQKANVVRLARAELKRRVADEDSPLTAAAVIADPPPEALTMMVADILRAQHRWAATRTRRFLAQVPVSERKPIGELTDRQRATIVALLEGRPTPTWDDLMWATR